ncbi:MAG: pyridoxamine 5'-phosphate oxidase family protein [Bacteroidota bacterium]
MRELIEELKVAMLVTERDGELRSRPMHTTEVEEDGTVYFFTSNDSGKVEEIEEDRFVNLAYSNPDKQNYLSISGNASIVNSERKIAELWNPVLKAWYPDGLETPKLRLIKVVPNRAEYWESSGNSLVQMFNIGKALIKGERYKAGVHEEVVLD